MQFGYNCDYVGVLPLDRRTALLVVNHEYTNEELMFPPGALRRRHHPPDRDGLAWDVGRRDPAWRRQRRRLAAGRAATPTYNRRITASTPFARHRAGRRRRRGCGPPPTRPGARARHAQQLRRRHDAVGHRALRRGELQPVLRRHRGARPALHGVVRALRHHRHRRAAAGARSTRGSTSPTSRTSRSGSAGSSSSTRTTRSHAAQAHDARPLQARGREHRDRRRTVASVAYMGDDERGDYLYKFVSPTGSTARDSHGRAQAQPARCSTTGTLYVARFTGDGSADGRYDGTGEWIPLTSDTTSYVAGLTRRRRADRHPARRGQGRRPRGWTVPRTSSRTRSTAGSTRP